MVAKKRKRSALSADAGAVVLSGLEVSAWEAARSRARSSVYRTLVVLLEPGKPVDVTVSLRPAGSARTVRSAVLAAARREGIPVQTAVTPEGNVLAMRPEQLELPKRKRKAA